MLIMALKPPVVSEQLRPQTMTTQFWRSQVGAGVSFLTDFFVLGSSRGLP